MSIHKDVMSFRSASASMFLKSRFVIVLVCTAGFSALSVSCQQSDSIRDQGYVQFDVLANARVGLGCMIQAECEVVRTCAYRRNER